MFVTPYFRHAVRLVLSSLVCLLLLPSTAHAQESPTTQLLVRESGTFRSARSIDIAHADEEGTVPPDTAAVRDADAYSFRYRPAGDWEMSTGDGEDLEQVLLQQGETTVPPQDARVNEAAGYAVASFAADEITITEAVVFKNDLATSAPLTMDEVFYPGYAELRGAYDAAQDTLSEAPLVAADTLLSFVTNDSLAQAFSFYRDARSTLDSAAFRALDRESATLRQLRDDLQTPSSEGLAQVDQFQTHLDSVASVLEPYLADDATSSTNSRDQMDLLIESAASMRESAYRSYRDATLRIYMRGDYDNYQLSRSLALLSRMLIDPPYTTRDNTLDLDTLSLDRLDAPRYASLRTEMEAYGWLGDFKEVINIVNNNITQHQVVFQEEVMQNLRLQRPGAPEPYYELFAAMNAVGQGDEAALSTHLDRALAKCTSVDFLHDIQLWRMVDHPSHQTLTEDVRDLIDEAQSLYENGQLDAAREAYVRASRMAGGYPPVQYYLGQIARENGELSAALAYYDRATELEPSYAIPEVAAVDALLENESYGQAVARADSALTSYPLWTIYYRKAKALIGQEKYDDARSVLRGRCEPLNDESFDLYITMGDTFLAMRQWSGARWAYEEAGSLQPQNRRFSERMQNLRSRVSDAGLSFQEIAPEETTREVSGSGVGEGGS